MLIMKLKKTKVINHNNSINFKGELTLKNSKMYSSKEIKDEDVFLTTAKARKTYNHLRSSMNYRYNGNKDMVIKNQKKNLNNSTRKFDDLSEYFISSKESKNITNNSLLKTHKTQKLLK